VRFNRRVAHARRGGKTYGDSDGLDAVRVIVKRNAV
jgi:hypothetical protein